MNRNYISYRESSIDWLSKIPIHWDESRIKKYFHERNEKVNDIEYPPLSVTKNGILPQLENVSKSDNHNDRKRVCINDFVINSRSDRKGSSGLSQLDGSVSLINIVLEPKNINPIFSEYLFKSKDFIEEFFRNGKGIHWDLWSTRYSELQNIKIPIPPLFEQQQIVSFLDTKTSLVDSLIEKTQRKIELLKEKRTSLINEVVTKGLNPNVKMKDSGVEWIGKIPSHWEFTRIKYFVNFDSGYSFKSDDYSENGIPLIRIGSLYNNTLSFERSPIFLPEEFERDYNQFVIEKNDILISMTGTLGKRDYGYSILYNEEFPSLLNQRVGRIRLSSERVNLNYLMYNLLSEPFLLQLFSKPTGTKQGNLSSDDIIGNYFGLPPLNEQQQIVEYLDEQTQMIDKTISIEEKRIELLKEYRQSLISEVVTGKRKVVE